MRIEQDGQQHTQAEIHAADANEPGTFAFLHPEEEQKGHDGQQQVNPGKFIRRAAKQQPQLTQKAAGIFHDIGRIGLLVLPAAQGVEKSFDRAWIAPLHGGNRHAGDGHVEVKGHARAEKHEHDADGQPIPDVQQITGPKGKPYASDQRADADEVEDHEHGRVGNLNQQMPAGGEPEGHVQQIDHKIGQEGVAPESWITYRQSDLNRQSHGQQALVNRNANTEEKDSYVSVAQLMRSVEPAQQANQHEHHPGKAENRNAVDDHRFAPDKPVQAHQNTSGKTGHDTDGTLPLAGHVLELLDPLNEQAAAARNQEGEQPARQRASRSLADGDAPSHVAEGQQHGPKPGIYRPDRVAGRMGDAGIKRGGHQLTRVFKGQLRGDGQKINDPNRGESEQECEPVDSAEERRNRRLRDRRDWLLLGTVLAF